MVLHWVSSIDRRNGGDESKYPSRLPDLHVSSRPYAQKHRLGNLPGRFEVHGTDNKAVLTTECSSELPRNRPKLHIKDSYRGSYSYGKRTLRSSLATTTERTVRFPSAISIVKASSSQWITNPRPSASVEPPKSPGIQIHTEIRRSSSCELNTAKWNPSGTEQEQVQGFFQEADFRSSAMTQGASDRTIPGDGAVWKSSNVLTVYERPASPKATCDSDPPVSPGTFRLNGDIVKDVIDARRGTEQGFGTQYGVTHFSDPFT